MKSCPLLLVVVAACGGDDLLSRPLPLTVAPGEEAQHCSGENALVIDGTASGATYVCTRHESESGAWASIDAHYSEYQINSASWMHHVLGLSVKIGEVPTDAQLDVAARPDLVKDLHLHTVDGLAGTGNVGSYSETVSFSGFMTVGQGTLPKLSVCILSQVGVPGSTTAAQVWMRAEAQCQPDSAGPSMPGIPSGGGPGGSTPGTPGTPGTPSIPVATP